MIRQSFENLLAMDPARFDPEDVSAARRGLGEFEEMVQVVYLLVLQAERMSDPADAQRALQIAEQVLKRLPLAAFVEFHSLLEKNRQGSAVVLPLRAVTDHLRVETGVSESLAAVVEDAAAAC